ncbi:MAG: hypothetical protein K2X77_31240 [Candidatus Obscuribacterales bacterium]|jgi:hypothetical protein|nr:hypothetical protein [Candidatus Obscuribacterales bacterium]
MNKSETADKILQDVTTLMDSQSNIEKFELRQKLANEWMWLTCSERLQVGKELENKTQHVKENEVKATFGYDETSNNLHSLVFDRYQGPYQDTSKGLIPEKRNHIVINDPFEGCNLKPNENTQTGRYSEGFILYGR